MEHIKNKNKNKIAETATAAVTSIQRAKHLLASNIATSTLRTTELFKQKENKTTETASASTTSNQPDKDLPTSSSIAASTLRMTERFKDDVMAEEATAAMTSIQRKHLLTPNIATSTLRTTELFKQSVDKTTETASASMIDLSRDMRLLTSHIAARTLDLKKQLKEDQMFEAAYISAVGTTTATNTHDARTTVHGAGSSTLTARTLPDGILRLPTGGYLWDGITPLPGAWSKVSTRQVASFSEATARRKAGSTDANSESYAKMEAMVKEKFGDESQEFREGVMAGLRVLEGLEREEMATTGETRERILEVLGEVGLGVRGEEEKKREGKGKAKAKE